jgi:hypothetical protein
VVTLACLLGAVVAGAQTATQFRADLRVRDLDGTTGTAKLYVGTARLRMEFPVGGETRPTIIDPKEESQFTISPGQRQYVEMPLGESGGTVRIPRINTMNPTNPCADDRLSDCKRLGAETVNGFPSEKWEYTNVDGDRVTAWISTRLRFPVRTTVENGATTEITNVVEGPQPANLFAVPAGFAKVDDLGGDDPLANIDPAMIARGMAMAQAMMAAGAGRGNVGAGDVPAAPRGPSPYEGGLGWVLNVTITAKGSTPRQGNAALQSYGSSSSTGVYTASIPFNQGNPPIPTQGPQWVFLPLAGTGSPQVEAAPLTFGVDTRVETIGQMTGDCTFIGRTDSTTVVTRKGQLSTTIAKVGLQVSGVAIWKFAPDLATYSLTAQLHTINDAQATETRTSRTVDHCNADRVTNQSESKKTSVGGLTFEVKDVRLTADAAGVIKGSATIPWTALQDATTATAEWTITRVSAR